MRDVGPSESVGWNSGRFGGSQREGSRYQADRKIGTFLHTALLLETDQTRRSYPQAGLTPNNT